MTHLTIKKELAKERRNSIFSTQKISLNKSTERINKNQAQVKNDKEDIARKQVESR